MRCYRQAHSSSTIKILLLMPGHMLEAVVDRNENHTQPSGGIHYNEGEKNPDGK